MPFYITLTKRWTTRSLSSHTSANRNDSNCVEDRFHSPTHGAQTEDRPAVGAIGCENSLHRKIIRSGEGLTGLHRAWPVHRTRLDGVDAGISVRLGAVT